jgi:hypothetical protein
MGKRRGHMDKKNEIEFEIKKKIYYVPHLKKYGTFADYTKSQSGNELGTDNQNYYGSNPTS